MWSKVPYLESLTLICLRPVMESIRRRREAIFGNVARMSPNIPAYQALRLQASYLVCNLDLGLQSSLPKDNF